MTSSWATVKYPFGYLLVNRYITRVPTFCGTEEIQPNDFAYLWLYIAMTDEGDCNMHALIIGLWGRYCADARLVGIEPIDGQAFIALVSMVNMLLREDRDHRDEYVNEITKILWETSDGDLVRWWRAWHQRGQELKLPLFNNDSIRSWARFIRHWDQLMLSDKTTEADPTTTIDKTAWVVGLGTCSLLGYGLVSWLWKGR